MASTCQESANLQGVTRLGATQRPRMEVWRPRQGNAKDVSRYDWRWVEDGEVDTCNSCSHKSIPGMKEWNDYNDARTVVKRSVQTIVNGYPSQRVCEQDL